MDFSTLEKSIFFSYPPSLSEVSSEPLHQSQSFLKSILRFQKMFHGGKPHYFYLTLPKDVGVKEAADIVKVSVIAFERRRATAGVNL